MSDELSSIRQREKFKALLRDRGISLRRMSIDLGLNESYFQQFVTYGRPAFVEGEILRKAAAYLGLPERELTAPASGFHEPYAQGGYHTGGYRGNTRKSTPESEVVHIPRYEQSQSFEQDDWRAEHNRTGTMAFSRQMLETITPTDSSMLALLKIHSDTMAPTLEKGDCALVDCSYTTATEDGIYAIAHESHLLIKRVTIDPIRKQVTLSRDNTAYPAIREFSLVDIRVAGRIVWAGKRL